MPLNPFMLNSAVRVSSAGDLLGSASLIGVESESEPGLRWPYVVTAHHVIRNAVAIELEIPDPITHTKLNEPVRAQPFRQPLPGVDLAISPFSPLSVPRYQACPLSHFLPAGHVVALGGPVYYLGMFAGREPDVPMCRTGAMGALYVPMKSGAYQYEAHLVDCRSYGGFSGSPCFSAINYTVLDEAVDMDKLPLDAIPQDADGNYPKLAPTAVVARFCGMLNMHYTDERALGGERVISQFGVGVMLPSDDIRRALMTDEAKQERREWDEEFARERLAS
jgi:hypothetical protein